MLVSIQGRADATTAPKPMKRLCMAKPCVRCSSGSRSATNARNGSMLTLIEESRIHSNPAATHSVDERGIKINAHELRIAPVRKYGRLRPNQVHVLSLECPMMG